MKKRVLFIATIALLMFASCQKKGLGLFQGDYSYKTSGSVTFTDITAKNDSVPFSFSVNLQNEIGRLEIATLDKKNDSVLVMMNAMAGKVTVARAHVENNKIHFADFPKKIQIVNINPSLDLECEVVVHAEGTMYNGNTLLVEMVYEGEYQIMNRSFSIFGSDIKLMATRN